MKHIFLDKISVGDVITSFYILNRAQIKKGKSTDYIEFELQDHTGPIRAVMWNVDQDLFHSLRQGGIVKIQGDITEYQGRNELHIKKIRMINDNDSVDMDNLIESTPREVNILVQDFEETQCLGYVNMN